MKHLKNLFAAALTLVVAMALSVTAFAAQGTIKITPPAGTPANATNTYKIYKVFDAVASDAGISYKLHKGTELTGDMATYFEVDPAGNVKAKDAAKDSEGKLTAGAIAAITAYVTESDLVDTATSTGTAVAESKQLDNGYYFIKTSTGTVVTIDSTTPNAEVIDKNTVPGVDKKITNTFSIDEDGKKALAQVGTDVEFTATVTFGTGSKNVKFHDTMGTGLSYNGDVTVTGVDSTMYTVGKEGGDTFTITFNDGIAKDAVATIKYTAKVTDAALTVDTGKNTATVSYGDNNATTPGSDTNVYNATISVIKNDENGKALPGAGFVLKNAAGKYYKFANNAVTWVDTEADATEYTSGDDGKLNGEFSGLANGTYTLVEKTVPAGYNKAADKEFTIAEHDYSATNLKQTATVVNESGAELPSTGGMGTTLFYVVGGLMVAGAAIALIAKSRVAKMEA